MPSMRKTEAAELVARAAVRFAQMTKAEAYGRYNEAIAVARALRGGNEVRRVARAAADDQLHADLRIATDHAMTREDLTAWLRMRGVNDEAYLAELLAQYAGKTEDEMDEIYDSMHGSMA